MPGGRCHAFDSWGLVGGKMSGTWWQLHAAQSQASVLFCLGFDGAQGPNAPSFRDFLLHLPSNHIYTLRRGSGRGWLRI